MDLSRRKLLGAMTTGTGAALAGCLGGDDDGEEATTLNIYAPSVIEVDWGHLYDSTGIEDVELTLATTDSGELSSQILEGEISDQYAMLNIHGTNESNFCDHLREIDPDRIENWDELPDYMVEPIDSPNHPLRCGEELGDEDRLVGMPTAANADSFVYNADETGDLTSYDAWFSEEFQGQVALEDNWATSLAKTALYLDSNNMADIESPPNMTPEEVETVADFLIEKKEEDQFRTLWSSMGEALDLITTGEVVIMDGWYPMVLAARDQGLEGAEYADTDEGYHKWALNSYIFDGDETARPGVEERAYEFLNYQLSGHYGAHLVMQTGYVVASPLAVDYAHENPDEVDVDFVEERYDDILHGKLNDPGYWTNRTPEHRETYEEEWQRFKTA